MLFGVVGSWPSSGSSGLGCFALLRTASLLAELSARHVVDLHRGLAMCAPSEGHGDSNGHHQAVDHAVGPHASELAAAHKVELGTAGLKKV